MKIKKTLRFRQFDVHFTQHAKTN